MNTMSAPAPLSASVTRLLALAAGMAVANSYYNQAFLSHIESDFALAAGSVNLIPVLTQAGNAAGVLFLAPLGDRLERKSLILMTISALVIALISAAFAPGFHALALLSLLVGLFATVAQQIVPMAVHLAEPQNKGRVLGKVTGGILIGILGARMIGGVIADYWGWPMVFGFAAIGMAVIGIALARVLPRVPASTDLGYIRLLGSLWPLLCRHRALRLAITVQFLIFAGFIGFWANLGLVLAGPDFGLGGTAVGILALIGIAGALAAPIAGGFADRYGQAGLVIGGTIMALLAHLLLAVWQGSLVALALGILALDLAVQSTQIANQAKVYALDPSARSRLNTIFMTVMLSGGAFGAGLGGLAFATWGWTGLCLFGIGTCTLALVIQIIVERRPG